MNLHAFKNALKSIEFPSFKLENGHKLAPHFHLTELGKISKDYIDCGGTLRQESWLSLQLWEADDFDHRLSSTKLLGIIRKTERQLALDDGLALEIEYQGATIGRYALALEDGSFILLSKQTDCLAKDACGIPEAVSLSEENLANTDSPSCCSPDSNCC